MEQIFREGRDFENYYNNRIPEIRSASLVFAGYGIHEPELGYDDLDRMDIGGKIVLILDESPKSEDPNSPFQKPAWREKYPKNFNWSERFRRAASLTKRGPVAVLVARNSLEHGDVYGDTSEMTMADDRPIIHESSRLVTLLDD